MAKKTFLITSIVFYLCVGFCNAVFLEVGSGVVDITGPDAVIIDPLHVKAIVFKQGAEEFAMVECDLSGVSNELVQEAKKLISEKCGISADRVCIAATHTHMGGHTKPNKPELIAEAVVQAQKNLRQMTVESISGTEYRIAHNRRYWMKDGTVMFNPMFLNPDIVCPAGPIDAEVNCILFCDAQTDKPVCSMTGYALHCDTVKEYGARYQKTGAGSPNAVSADYPYWLETFLREKFGKDFVSMYNAGCSGNINHWDFSKPGPQSGHETMAKGLGQSLANAVLAELDKSEKTTGSLAVRSRVMQIPLQSFTAEELAWAKALGRGQMSGKSEEPNEREQFLNNVRKRRILKLERLRKNSSTLPLQVQAVKIDDNTAIVTLPGEMFVENGLTVKNLSPFENTMVVELANSSCGYIPNKKAFSQGGYEVENSILAPGGAEMMIQAAVEMLNELKPAKERIAGLSSQGSSKQM